MKQLLLFDIDGTLVDTGGAGLAALLAGMRDAFPAQTAAPLPFLDLRGATDAGVIRTLFQACGVVDCLEHRQNFIEAYLRRLDQGLRIDSKGGPPHALPGVASLLLSLSMEPERYSLGLLTGNLEAGAFAKLRRFSLDGYFRFGAYGLDREHRTELGPIALERAREVTGRDYLPSETIIIGDTPKDIECARAFGARCVAVATGGFAHEEIAAHAPDAVLTDLSGPGELQGILSQWLRP